MYKLAGNTGPQVRRAFSAILRFDEFDKLPPDVLGLCSFGSHYPFQWVSVFCIAQSIARLLCSLIHDHSFFASYFSG